MMGEVENITPGLSRELRVELPAGTYQTACKPGMIGDGIRADVHRVRLGAGADRGRRCWPRRPPATRGTSPRRPRRWCEQTTDFVAAVKAGDVAKAKALYPVARTYCERIEPVAEIFGDLDPKIDGREDGATTELPFTGFHRLEKDLWVSGDISQVRPDRRPAAGRRQGDRHQGQGGEARPRCSSRTAPRGCSTRWPPARSPARRSATPTPTCGTSTANVDGLARRPSRRCARRSSSATPRWSSSIDAGFADVEAELDKYRDGRRLEAATPS